MHPRASAGLIVAGACFGVPRLMHDLSSCHILIRCRSDYCLQEQACAGDQGRRCRIGELDGLSRPIISNYLTLALYDSQSDVSVVNKLIGKAEVVQLFRYPGLSDSAAKTLLRKVRSPI